MVKAGCSLFDELFGSSGPWLASRFGGAPYAGPSMLQMKNQLVGMQPTSLLLADAVA